MPAQDLIGLRGSFLGDISEDAFESLIECAGVRGVGRGELVFSDRFDRSTGVLLEGICRAYLTGPDGRQLTLRYARPRTVITTSTTGAVNHPLPVELQAVTDVAVMDLDFKRLIELQRSDPSVIRALAAEASRRLSDVYRSFAATYYGTLKERLAGHLLDSAQQPGAGDTLSAPVTQHDLAVALGTVREVVSRTLQQMQSEGVVKLRRGSIELSDAKRLMATTGSWWMPSRAFTLDGSSVDGSFDAAAQPVIAIDARGDVIYANPAITETFGCTPRDIVGSPASRLLSDGSEAKFVGSVGELDGMQSGALSLVGSCRGRRADGVEFPVEITLMPVRAGGPAVAFATFVDLSYQTALRSRIEAAMQARATSSAQQGT